MSFKVQTRLLFDRLQVWISHATILQGKFFLIFSSFMPVICAFKRKCLKKKDDSSSLQVLKCAWVFTMLPRNPPKERLFAPFIDSSQPWVLWIRVFYSQRGRAQWRPLVIDAHENQARSRLMPLRNAEGQKQSSSVNVDKSCPFSFVSWWRDSPFGWAQCPHTSQTPCFPPWA